MSTAWSILTFFLLFTCSCQFSKAKTDRKNTPLLEFISANQISTSDKPLACEGFTRLSKKKDFVLADVAYVKSLKVCPKESIQWDREVPAWLTKEKQLAAYENLTTVTEKAVFIANNPQYFPSPDRIKMYQAALEDKAISEENKAQIEGALFAIAPRFMPEPKPEFYFSIVKDLRSVRDFDKTREMIKKIIQAKETTPENKLLAHRELFFTNKLQRSQKLEPYIKAAKDWAEALTVNKNLSPELLQSVYEAKLNYARVLWTERGVEPALKEMKKIREQMNGKISIYDIYWLKARMLEEQKKPTLAIAEYENALKEKIALWRDQEKILWSLSWTYMKQKNYSAADKYFSQLIENKETSPYARFKYTYWLAEARKQQGKTEDATGMWTNLSNEDTFGYYGMISRLQLNIPLRKIVSVGDLSRGLSDKDDEVFQALQKVQELELASRFLGAVLPDSASIKKSPASDIASILRLYAEVKNYKYVFMLFNQLSFENQRSVFDKIPEILFPQPYGEFTTKSFELTKVEPELVYSIMRQESSFDPKARSPMDAFGLVQILPEVAKRIAKENNIPMNNYEDLFDEEKNILIGSYLLKRQSQQFDNKFPLYVASYNASGSAVRQWHKRFVGDDIMFIEEIPYEETKTYVKLVMRNYVLYKKIKNGDSFEFFPRELINIQ